MDTLTSPGPFKEDRFELVSRWIATCQDYSYEPTEISKYLRHTVMALRLMRANQQPFVYPGTASWLAQNGSTASSGNA
jgi:hypothetical protein